MVLHAHLVQLLRHARNLQVTLVVRHLYQRCLENSKVAHSSQADICSQLKVIGSFIADLSSILQEHNVKVAVRP